jgi:hypothetical protein
MKTPLYLVSVAGLMLVVAGCASTPAPVGDLARAHTLISQAEQSDAPRYDGADLAAAQSEMQRADQEARSHPEMAARLARRASVDAELALARTRANKEKDALNEVTASTAALKREVEQPSPAAVTGEPPPATPSPLPGGPQQ